MFQGNLPASVPIIAAFAVVIAIIFISKTLRRIVFSGLSGIYGILRALFSKPGGPESEKFAFEKALAAAGYAYDSVQDMFYSIMDPWQRDYGYCRLYDEAAAPLSMIIDSEPVYFEYGGKKWLIEFWKGQYAMVTGAEVGVYTTTGPDLNIPGVFYGTFYFSASDEDRLWISYTLKRNGKVIFKRKDRHWWLTGFKLGMFAEPSELSMDISITLKDEAMCDAFIKGLKKSGYTDNEIMKYGYSIMLSFRKPHMPQPLTRTAATDWVLQRKNESLCKDYQEITRPYSNIEDKIKAVFDKAPDLYEKLIFMGKSKKMYDKYELIGKYLH